MKKLVFFGLVSIGLIATTVGQITQNGSRYSVIAKYKQGRVTKMIMSVKSDMSKGGPGNTTINGSTKVIAVNKDGSASIEVKTPAFGGTPASTQIMVVDKYGRPRGNSVGTFSGNFSWPSYPIKIGESWTGNIDLSGGNGAPRIPLKATYKFTGIKTLSGIKVAVISAKIDISSMFQMKGSGEMFVRFDDGQLYESNLTMSMMAPDQKTQKPTRISMLVSVKNRR